MVMEHLPRHPRRVTYIQEWSDTSRCYYPIIGICPACVMPYRRHPRNLLAARFYPEKRIRYWNQRRTLGREQSHPSFWLVPGGWAALHRTNSVA